MENQNVSSGVIDRFTSEDPYSVTPYRLTIQKPNSVVGCSVLLQPKVARATCKLFIHINQGEENASLYIDHLLERMLRRAGESAPKIVELELSKGQNLILSTAKARGFSNDPESSKLNKIVLCKAVTNTSWTTAIQELRLETGVNLPKEMPTGKSAERFKINFSRTKKIEVSLKGLESLLSPALFLRPDIQGVIVPITRPYSESLLGVSRQLTLSLWAEKDASFYTTRAYVNSPKSENIMQPDLPILFYESKGSNGIGAIISVARIVTAQKFRKDMIPEEFARRMVVENLDHIASSNEVLVTSFNNLFPLDQPVSFEWLRQNGIVNRANLVTATQIPGKFLTKILNEGSDDVDR